MLNPRTMKVVVRPSFISCLICGMRIELGMMRVVDTGNGKNLVLLFGLSVTGKQAQPFQVWR